MPLEQIKNELEIVKRSLSYLNPEVSDSLHDYDKTRTKYYIQLGASKITSLKGLVKKLPAKQKEILMELNYLDARYNNADVVRCKGIIDKITSLLEEIDEEQEKKQKFLFEVPKFPIEIAEEIKQDINEMERCFKAKCFRAAIILCGRILETALFRLYYEKTANDLLETAPGIGLGKVIARLAEAGVELNPGINEQIHLINKVRISSVHKKREPFNPSKEQAQAIILFTGDVLKKVF